jgi:hypothetical protein
MHVTEVKFDPATLVGPVPITGDSARSSGLHLSQIYGDLETTVRGRREPMEDTQLNAYRAIGFVWEHIVAHGMAMAGESSYVIRPGEFELDGIAGSPDLIDVRDLRVIDTKATYRSSRRCENLQEDFWIWMVQQKGYCKMVGTDLSRLIVLFMMGDYKQGPRPEFRQFDFQWEQKELDDNWKMIVNHAKKRGWLK